MSGLIQTLYSHLGLLLFMVLDNMPNKPYTRTNFFPVSYPIVQLFNKPIVPFIRRLIS